MPRGCYAEHFLEYLHDLYGKGYKTEVEFSASSLELKLTAKKEEMKPVPVVSVVQV